jgi:serine/threonine protein kinase
LTGHFGYLYDWYAFKAPEIDSDFFHDKTVDMWSLGAFMYMMLTGLPPFRGNGADLIANKHRGNVVFDTIQPSASVQRLVRSLLQVNPYDRPTVEQVLTDEWMVESDNILSGWDLSLAQTILSDWEQLPS